jgi:hypothetical protein
MPLEAAPGAKYGRLVDTEDHLKTVDSSSQLMLQQIMRAPDDDAAAED